MAHEILSIKLSELEEQIARLISRIQLSETADRAQLRREIGSLKQEYLENELILQKKLQLSRAEVVATIARTYEEIQPSIRHGWDALQTQVSGNDSMNEGQKKGFCWRSMRWISPSRRQTARCCSRWRPSPRRKPNWK